MSSTGVKLAVPTLTRLLLAGTVLAGVPAVAQAQDNALPAGQEALADESPESVESGEPGVQLINSLTVVGSQRLEPQTILSYVQLSVGAPYTQAAADQALKDLYATELFADVRVRHDQGNVVIEVTENPVINRIILEGNKKIKDDKILPEIKLAPRQIFTRSKVRADVARIIELYKRKGRFAAKVEPQMVQLEQNRVDIVFEISEGPKSKVRQINILGNEEFSDGELRGEMVTKQSRFFRLFSSNTSYDPDRLAFDQQKLRQFYLTEGYADFRVVSAVAELTPDKKDFIITYVVEEGERYKFGDVTVDSQLRDFRGEELVKTLPMEQGDWYNAKLVEDTVERLSEVAGTLGYAFADVRPRFDREKDDLTMGITFTIAEAPRVYVEKININGNTLTQDKVIRREFRIAEGDAFNSIRVKRSTNRIKSLGYFQENFEIEQKEGSAPDRIILEANVEERPTGELQLSAGFSSLESFILQASVQQRNFRGRGQTVGVSVNYSRYTRAVQLSFTEPYLFDRNISAGIDVYRRDLNSFNFLRRNRSTTFERSTTGMQLRLGVPMTEYLTAIARYTINYDDVSLSNRFFSIDEEGNRSCEPLIAGRYLCDALGKRLSSILGASLIYDKRDSRYRPTRGHVATVSVDFAGLGGETKYLRIRADASKYWSIGGGFIFSVGAEGGYIHSLESRTGEGIDDIRLTDRFFLGEPQLRGFDIRGVGPRVLRKRILTDEDGNPFVSQDRADWTDDALGGKAYYMARAELEIPLGTGARELGLRPSIFVDAGAVFGVTRPVLLGGPQTFPDGVSIPIRDNEGNQLYTQIDERDAEGNVTATSTTTSPNAPDGTANVAQANTISPFVEEFVGNSAKPRLAIGFGVNWNSPFGPLRLDFAKVLLKEEGDDTKAFSFNVGTQF